MKLTSNTILQENLLSIEGLIARTSQAISTAINLLNASHQKLWTLPDDELQEVLQTLLESESSSHSNKLEEMFVKHGSAAVALNTAAELSGVDHRALAVAGRKYTISDGVITIVPKESPEEEIEAE